MSLTEYINKRKKDKSILIMAHQVLGYPDFETNYEMIKLFAKYNIDLIELQIPFSEPLADGPLFLKANQEALMSSTTVKECVNFAKKVYEDFGIPLIFMTYYNVMYSIGIERFVKLSKESGVKGFIIPDALPEQSEDYVCLSKKYKIDPIFLATSYTPKHRLRYLSETTGGFLYCVARKGVTGYKTNFDVNTAEFLNNCKKISEKPLGLGFGIQNKKDIDFLIGKSDIAIIGSQLLKLLNDSGLEGVEEFLASITE
ncbi:tryptophan synthase subunit alpha [Evansella sp. AB-P1]|uniref:tryptophan synthase subunit alpha n=1 Tax=Evansella sp. AB-P1 TaxID=3037653 RepID=UPI00241C9B97|nr:tryptophan synthase subunit alpha [Evansella sp. AB-P1]MDG5788619.1 tryptophan synthase subunit alpha [Evansella sp. AB-P1]